MNLSDASNLVQNSTKPRVFFFFVFYIFRVSIVLLRAGSLRL